MARARSLKTTVESAVSSTSLLPARTQTTSERILDAALTSFAYKGYEATSLDGLAVTLGIRKQTILHHFGSKDALLERVMETTVAEFGVAIDGSLRRPGSQGRRLESVIRAVFSLAAKRPELLGLVREVGRIDPAHLERLADLLEPLAQRATAFLGASLDIEETANGQQSVGGTPVSRGDKPASGRKRPDPRTVVLYAYAFVIAVATEFEVLRTLDVRPSARLLLRRRRELLRYLGDMVGVDGLDSETKPTARVLWSAKETDEQ